MASRAKSESGAYMSQYDTEVEKRLKALEAEVKKLKEEVTSLSQKAAAPVKSAPAAGLEKKVEVLEYVLRCNEPNFDKLSKKI